MHACKLPRTDVPQRDFLARSERIAVFRALMLGDMLCAVPALRALRGAFPTARIVLVGLAWAREFVHRFSAYLDEFQEFPGYPGLPECDADISRIPSFLHVMQEAKYDLAIQLHGSGTISNPLTALFGAKRTAGFYRPGGYCADPALYLPYPDSGLELRRLLRLMEHMGVRPLGESLEFPIAVEDEVRAGEILSVHRLEPCAFVVVHAGASVSERRWPAKRFAEVADHLASRGLAVVLTGTPNEASLTTSVARAMKAPAIDLAGQTALGPLAAVLSRSRMLICNDTGVSHLADALHVPSVVISTGDNPERWAPVDDTLHPVLCHENGVPAAEVIAEADRLASEATRRHPAFAHCA